MSSQSYWGDGDPNFNKTMIKLFGSDSQITRKQVFYSICIIVRTLLYSSLFFFYKYDIVKAILLILSVVSIIQINMSMGLNGQWWSKYYQISISIVITILIIFDMALKLPNADLIIPSLFMLSLFGGIAQAMYKFT